MLKMSISGTKHAKEEDLRDMGDVQSGMASTIMQVYLKHVLEAFFTSRSLVRLDALNVIQLVLKQGLIHPVQVIVGHKCTLKYKHGLKHNYPREILTHHLCF